MVKCNHAHIHTHTQHKHGCTQHLFTQTHPYSLITLTQTESFITTSKKLLLLYTCTTPCTHKQSTVCVFTCVCVEVDVAISRTFSRLDDLASAHKEDVSRVCPKIHQMWCDYMQRHFILYWSRGTFTVKNVQLVIILMQTVYDNVCDHSPLLLSHWSISMFCLNQATKDVLVKWVKFCFTSSLSWKWIIK